MNLISVEKILLAFPQLIQGIVGSPNVQFSSVSSLENIQKDSLVFLLNEKNLTTVLNSPASVVIVPLNFKKESLPHEKTWLLSPNPELAMRFIKNEFVQKTPYRSNPTNTLSPTAQIDSRAKINSTAVVCSGAVIGPNVEIGSNVFIGANSVIEEGAVIGEDSTIHPLVYIGHSTIIGRRCEVKPNTTIASEGYGYAHDEKWNHYRIPHTGRVVLHDDVHIGANCAIDRGTIEDTIIGSGTRIDNQCHLAHNSVIGKNGLVTAQFGMAGSSTIGNNFVSGGKASVTGHVKIADNVQISGMSGVTKNIEKSGQYGGFPLQPLRDYLRTKAALVQIHDLRQRLEKFLENVTQSKESQ